MAPLDRDLASLKTSAAGPTRLSSPGAQAGRPYQLRWCSGGSQAAVPSEPLGQRGRGLSLGALALTMLTLGPRRSGLRKRGRTPEEVVSTYIQNCQLFVYSEVVSTYIQNCQLFVYVGASAVCLVASKGRSERGAAGVQD